MNYITKLFSLKNKTALVTGAAGGIGKSITYALANAGAKVILVDILKDKLNKIEELLKSKQLDVIAVHCDITNEDDINELMKFINNKFNTIDVLINSAGVTHGNEIFTYPTDKWEHTYQVNLKAPFELSKRVAGIMKKNKSGSIINITSINAELAFPDNPAYVAFKGGLKQLSKSLALDLGKYGIRVNNIGPGYFRTDMTKKSWADIKMRKEKTDRTILGRWGTPDDLAGLVILLSSEASSYITGQDIYVDGGWLSKGL